ncbi:TetR/AcrR family transcriptional regulator [Pantoea sp.]|uniref:TetR/AcrR family transcriptional regulator n=1 Tax=Pantoea sp. TaxID=69393 RepID=UPI0031CECEC8
MKESKEILRAKILDAAIVLFIEKGIDKTSTRDLTEHVGISRSHIYHYFSDWQALCIEALERFIHRELEEFEQQTQALSSRDQLNALIVSFLPEAADASWQLYGSLWQQAAHDDAYADLAVLVTQKWIAVIAGIIEQGIKNGTFKETDTARAARQLGAMLNGYADLLIIRPAPEECRIALADIEHFVSLIL